MNIVFTDTLGILGNNVFFDLTNSRLGLGVFPSAKLHLVQEGVEGCQGKIEAFSDYPVGPYLTLRRNKGTIASPQPVVAGDRLGEIIFDGRLGIGSTYTGSSIACIVDSVPDSLHLLARIEFYAGYAKRISINPDGKISIDNGVLKLSTKTTVDRDALSPENGMVIFNSDTNMYQGYKNGTWVNIA